MVCRRLIAYMNVLMPLWFLALYLVMSSARKDYSHLTDAISELGSLDAPNLWAWNILGYVLPGITIALLGIALYRVFPSHPRRSKFAAFGLVGFGLLMALSGAFPANMSDLSSTTSEVHILCAMGSFPFFLVAGLLYPKIFLANGNWKWVSVPSLVLVMLSIASGLLRFWGDYPGVGQRVTFVAVFLWLLFVSIAFSRSIRYPNRCVDI